MKDKNFTARDLSRASDVPYTTIRSMIERDLSNASIDNTIKICKALNITVEDILKDDDLIMEETTLYGINKESFYKYMPIPVSAGELSTIEATTPEQISVSDVIMGKYAGNEDIFFMRVNGDSMNKVIPHESLIAVKRVNLDALRNDDIVVFSNDHEYSVKRFYDDKENKRLIFGSESTDRSFTDHPVNYNETENLVIHGRVVLYIVKP